jgi:hypothetical protein
VRRVAVLLLFQIASAQAQAPEIVTRTRADCSRGVDFHALVTPETVFVGQQATYQLGVFIDQETRSRLRRNPEFLPPESRSMLSYDLPDRGNVFNGTIGGQPCEAHMFRRALFPLTPGRYAIPPARLTYALPQSPSFFSREEAFSLRSEGVTLVAIDPPVAGRPADWAGAVGSWRASARVDTTRGRAGDPLVLTLRVEGQGNVTLLPRPPLTIGWAAVVAADERVRVDSTPTALRGSKDFDWLVTPNAGGAQRVPAIRYTYFNPFSRRYEAAFTQPFTVRVAPGDVVAPDVAATTEPPARPLTLRVDLGDETAPPLGDLPWVRWVLALSPLPALAGWVSRRPRRPRRASTPLERLRALRDPASAGRTPAIVRRLFLDGLLRRTGLEAAVLAQPGAWTRALRLEGVSDECARNVEALLDELDRRSFGGQEGEEDALAASCVGLLVRVGREARYRAGVRRPARAGSRGIAALAVVLAGTGTLHARDIGQASVPFAQGMTAYAGADFVRASRLFEDAARQAPRSPAAWANAGTAAWAARDTAGAVVGWQRALRLDPTAPELRARLAQVRAPQDVGPARVLALPARLPSAIAILLWLAGWGLVAGQCWRRRPAIPLAVATLLVAGALTVAARMVEDRLQGRGLAVVTDPSALRALPALGAEGSAVPLVGEVARVVQRQGVWTHIQLDGGRDGWIASERLAALGSD